MFWFAAAFIVLGLAVMGAGWISSNRAQGSADQRLGGLIGGFTLMVACWAIAVLLAVIGLIVRVV